MNYPSNSEMLKLSRSLRATTAFLKRHGCTPVRGHYGQGYHYHSGFFTSPGGKMWYWAAGDDRLPPAILFRRAKDVRDFTGGLNQYPVHGEAFDTLIANGDGKPESDFETLFTRPATAATAAV